MSHARTLVQQDLAHWFDEVLSQPMLASKVALHVNLYETEDSILVELMGTSSFSAGANPETDCWPGDATF